MYCHHLNVLLEVLLPVIYSFDNRSKKSSNVMYITININ